MKVVVILILFVVGLFLAALSARMFKGPIEADLGKRAEKVLSERGLSGVTVDFDYLDATLRGNVKTKELKAAAVMAVADLPGVRVVSNQISFGADLVPSLVFSAGEPVRVVGSLNKDQPVPEFGSGFDMSGVEFGAVALMPWSDELNGVVAQFFDEVDAGRLELNGSRVLVSGKVINAVTKWRILDQMDALSENLELIDQLTVQSPSPFRLAAKTAASGVELSGSVGKAVSLERLSRSIPGSGVASMVHDPSVVEPRWLADVLESLGRLFDLAIEVQAELEPTVVVLKATFASQFWLDAVETDLRRVLQDQVELKLDFQVALKALAEVQPEGDAEVVRYPLPLRISIAGDRMLIEGKVRLEGERDSLLELLGKIRPDLKIESQVKFDYREPKLDSLRERLPAMLAYAISGISSYGEIDLDAEVWRYDVVCDDEEFQTEVVEVMDALAFLTGIEIESNVRLIRLQQMLVEVWDELPIYFKSSSAQIEALQSEKLQYLVARLSSLRSDESIVLVGSDGGDGRLGMQRARAVRRVLVSGGVPIEKVEVRAGLAESPISWRSHRVGVEIHPTAEVD